MSLSHVGKRFSRLIVKSTYLKQCKNQRCTHAICVCDCGRKHDTRLSGLTNGHTRSCGCIQKEQAAYLGRRNYKHGKIHHKLYVVWSCMKDRCTNCNATAYHNYGGRGINICNEWQEFIVFYNWAIKFWKKDLQIDRIDNDGNYCPENCRFVTQKENQRNTRKNVFVTAFGETKTIIEWSEDKRCKVKYETLRCRISSDWDMEKAITQNHQRKGKK